MKIMKYVGILVIVEGVIVLFLSIYNPLDRFFDNTFYYYPIIAIVLMLSRVYNNKIGLKIERIGFMILGIAFVLHYILY